MKKTKKFYRVNVYNNILEHGFGWYKTNVPVYANNIKECIKKVNTLFPFESSLLIDCVTDDKIYAVSESRKSYSRQY